MEVVAGLRDVELDRVRAGGVVGGDDRLTQGGLAVGAGEVRHLLRAAEVHRVVGGVDHDGGPDQGADPDRPVRGGNHQLEGSVGVDAGREEQPAGVAGSLGFCGFGERLAARREQPGQGAAGAAGHQAVVVEIHDQLGQPVAPRPVLEGERERHVGQLVENRLAELAVGGDRHHRQHGSPGDRERQLLATVGVEVAGDHGGGLEGELEGWLGRPEPARVDRDPDQGATPITTVGYCQVRVAVPVAVAAGGRDRFEAGPAIGHDCLPGVPVSLGQGRPGADEEQHRGQRQGKDPLRLGHGTLLPRSSREKEAKGAVADLRFDRGAGLILLPCRHEVNGTRSTRRSRRLARRRGRRPGSGQSHLQRLHLGGDVTGVRQPVPVHIGQGRRGHLVEVDPRSGLVVTL